jgi:predicted RNA binding protein YcfA (HicA-like mRNA interferase family)
VSKLPAISGKQLIKLLKKDGWAERRKATHGISLAKKFCDRTRVTVVPNKTDPIPIGTLKDILGHQQTGLTSDGLRALIDKHGLA